MFSLPTLIEPCQYSCDPQRDSWSQSRCPFDVDRSLVNFSYIASFENRLSFDSIALDKMKFCITTLLLAVVSIQLHLTLAFPFSFYSVDRRTLNTLLPVNVTSESTSQNKVIPSTNLTGMYVTFAPWPPIPFRISLPSTDYILDIMVVSPWTPRIPIDLASLVDFIASFYDNLEQKYPPPALAPRTAGSKLIDAKTLTRWTIEYQRGNLAPAVPTEIVLDCVDVYDALLRRHGPATIGSVVYKKGTIPLFWANQVLMSIDDLAGSSLNISLPSGNYDFDTM